MKEKVLSLFVEQRLKPNAISKKLGISEQKVKDYLFEERYLTSNNRSVDRSIRLKQAIDYFLSDNSISATKAARAFRIDPTSFCLDLKKFGITAENKQNRTKFNENVFDVIDTEEKAYWLGFIFADGGISSHSELETMKKRYQFELSLSDVDHEHLDKFNIFMQHEKDNVIVGTVNLNGKKFKRCRWIINNKHLWNTLNNIGCTPNKSLTLIFPNIPNYLKRHFIRGYFDGDGSLGIYGDKIQCSCLGTVDMLDNILKDLELRPKYHHDSSHSENTYSFQLVSEKAVKFLDYIYKDSTIYLQRKFEKYKEVCRLWEKFHRLLESKIGEDCDVDPEVN